MTRPDGRAQVFGVLPQALAATASARDDLLRRTEPAAITGACPSDRSMRCGVGPGRNGEVVACIAARARWNKHGVRRGVALDDAERSLEGTGAAPRHVRRAAAEFDPAPLAASVVAAFAGRRAVLGRT